MDQPSNFLYSRRKTLLTSLSPKSKLICAWVEGSGFQTMLGSVALGISLLLLVGSVHAGPVLVKRSTPTRGDYLREGWQIVSAGKAFSPEKLKVRLALQQRNLDVLEREFTAVSTPGNPRYGHYWSREKISALTAPAATEVAELTEHASKFPGISLSVVGDYAEVTAESMSILEEFLSCKMALCKDPSDRTWMKIISGSYEVPRVVQFAQNLDRLFHVRRLGWTSSNTRSAPGYSQDMVIPKTLQKMYSIGSTVRSTHHNTISPS
jgi:subtilase family serine protease